jgi:purine-binding chemotaxis protein CheW
VKRQYVTFRVGEQLVGVDILLVREINRALPATTVQLADPHIVGLVNLRGQIVTVFDLACRVGLQRKARDSDPHDIVLRTNSELFALRHRHQRSDLTSGSDVLGLRVDSVAEIVEAEDEGVEPVVANLTHLNHRFLSGVVTLERELLILLDVEALAATS